MKASEIRVGNWVTNSIGEEYQITPATILHLSVDSATVNSIPFTEEWLLRFGFEKVNSTWYKGRLSKFRVNVAFDIEYSNHWLDIRIDFVHQLQNLYFALTGEELTITE